MTDYLAWYVEKGLRQLQRGRATTPTRGSMLTARPQRAKDKGGRHPWNAFRQGGLPHGWFQTQGRRPHVTKHQPMNLWGERARL